MVRFKHKYFHDLLRGSSDGFTIMELMVTLGIMFTLMGIAALNFHQLEQPAATGASSLTGFIKKTRAKALATTYAYTIKPSTTSQVITTYGITCTAAQTADGTLTLKLPTRANFTSVIWSICYSTRGITDTSIDIIVNDGTIAKTVQVALGGGVRVQ